MAFSNLVKKTKDQYDAISTYFEESKTGTPDPSVINIELKGWVSGTVLAFKVTSRYGTEHAVTVAPTPDNSPDPKTLNIAVAGTSTFGDEWYGYYTVDLGSANSRGTDWEIRFDVMANDRTTGKWIFKKGGTGEPNF